jgi:hypothetical protein
MSGANLTFTLDTATGRTRRPVAISTLVVAGWTGRDKAAMEKHIVELEALGVPRPASTPLYYRIAASRLSTDDAIEAMGGESSGEVEFILVGIDGRLWVGTGSDHTDRKAETIGITMSKQMCEKPVAATLWPMDEVADHWDKLMLRSWRVENGARTLYQEGPVTTMQDPGALIAGLPGSPKTLPDGWLMFCGTLAAKGGIRPAPRFEFALEDPVRGRAITHGYDIAKLPIAENPGG